MIQALVLLCLVERAFTAQLPIPLCAVEGPDVFNSSAASVGTINCQPETPTSVLRATCWTRYPDSVLPIYFPQCHCFANGDTNAPGLLPGRYAIAGSGPCAPGNACVLTSLVNPRSWSVDGGCDSAGDLCTPQAALAPVSHAASVVDCQKCRIRADAPSVCHRSRCRRVR